MWGEEFMSNHRRITIGATPPAAARCKVVVRHGGPAQRDPSLAAPAASTHKIGSYNRADPVIRSLVARPRRRRAVTTRLPSAAWEATSGTAARELPIPAPLWYEPSNFDGACPPDARPTAGMFGTEGARLPWTRMRWGSPLPTAQPLSIEVLF